MLPKKKILIIEDNALNRMFLRQILDDEYEVLEAENGEQGLQILREGKDDIMMVLLDVIMPVMDGYAFLDIVTKDEELSRVPVIVMTQRDSEADEVKALSHGATDFVPKPYRPQIILHRVASLIKLRENAAMVNLFKFDSLTGLYSKAFFYQKVKERLAENPDHDYCIISTNIENFTLYNDSFGREAGDQLLKEAAELFQKYTGEGSVCGRYSGDRYLCMAEKKQTDDLKNTIGSILSDGLFKNGQLSVKFGIYEITDRSITVEQMCDRALLVVDSISGKYDQHVAVYDDDMREKMLHEKVITDCMEEALAEKQFVVYYQPKINLEKSALTGAEALVRWIHPEWGFMSPAEFIPLFEKNGFISHLDEYVWECVCRQLKEWKDKGYPLVPVSVNVSRADIYHEHLVDIFRNLVEKYDIDPFYLHLEITESAYTENPDQIIETANQLRHLGFVIEMDDFGSGYSSLNILSQMSIDVLKLDYKFIQNELARPAEKSLIEDVINMAHRLCLTVVAEGVETREQEQRLRMAGCDIGQGFLFARPIPVDEFEKMLLNSRCPVLSTVPAKDTKRKLILLDEDENYRKCVLDYFADSYDVLVMKNSKQAVETIESLDDPLSVVLFSMTLPDNETAEFLSLLKKRRMNWKSTLIATVSCMKILDEKDVGEEFDGLFCKSFPLKELQRRIEKMLSIEIFHERESELRETANHDYLTGLLNRRGLQQAISEIRKKDLPLAVYLFDLDYLKEANDTGGHETGDRMLQEFATLLRSHTRQTDVLCRYGGDEFVALLKNVKDEKNALRIGEQICQTFHCTHEGKDLYYGCSCGATVCPVGEIPSASLIDRADQALYKAKSEYKGSCILYESLDGKERENSGRHLK